MISIAVIADILKTIAASDLPNNDTDANSWFRRVANKITNSKSGRNNSIIDRSKKNLMYYPVVVSDSLSRTTMDLLSSFLETEYALLLKLVMEHNPINTLTYDEISDTSNKDVVLQKILNQYYSQVDITVYDQVISTINSIRESDEYYSEEANSRVNKSNLNKMSLSKNIKKILDESEVLTEAPIQVPPGVSSVNQTPTVEINTSDVKKKFEGLPTTFAVSFKIIFTKTGNGPAREPITLTLPFAIKTTVHAISSSEIPYFIGTSVRREKVLPNLLRVLTGEISFIKDFYLNLDYIKKEVIASKKGKASKWWAYLKGKARMNSVRHMFNKNEFIPNATMIFSVEEYEKIKSDYGIDLKNPTHKNAMFNVFLIMRFIIVDEVNEIIEIFEPEDVADTSKLSFKQLARETTKNNNELKDIIKLAFKK